MTEEKDWMQWTAANIGGGALFGTAFGGLRAYYTVLPPSRGSLNFESNLNSLIHHIIVI
jgi:hypothetical protein